MAGTKKYIGGNRLQEIFTKLKDEFDKKADKDSLGTSSTKDYTDTFDEDGVEVTTGKAVADAINTEGVIDTPSQIMSFADGSDSPMKSCEVSIEPVQDLHGYDRPWAGGAGKNLLPMTVDGIKAANTSETWSDNDYTLNGVTFTILTDNDGNVIGIKANGTSTADFTTLNIPLFRVEVGTYKLSGISGGAAVTYRINAYVVGGGSTTIYDGEDTLELTSGGECHTDIIVRYANVQLNNVTFYPMIRLSTDTDQTFAPYSNICLITGHDEVTVEVTGANVWDEEWEVGSIDPSTGQNITYTSTIRSKNYIRIKQNTLYYFKSSINGILFMYDSNKNFLNSLNIAQNATFTTTTDAEYIRFRLSSDYGTTYNHDISINYPSTDTTYHAYNPKSITYTTDLGTTVYGGTLDLVSGLLTVTHVMDDLGTLNWGKTSTAATILFTNITGKKTGVSPMICDRYKYERDMGFGLDFGSISDSINASYVDYTFIRNKDFAGKTAEECATLLSSTQLVYELATPQTCQLTPTQVRSLLGTNNVWSDSVEMNKIIYTKGTTTLSLTIADLYNIIANLEARVKELEGEDEVDLSTMSDEDLNEMPEEEEAEEETAEET